MNTDVSIRVDTFDMDGERLKHDQFVKLVVLPVWNSGDGIRLKPSSFEDLLHQLRDVATSEVRKLSVSWVKAYAYSSAGLCLAVMGVHTDAIARE